MLKKSSQTIGLFSLVMLISGAIDSVRNLPATALFGNSLVFFFIFATLVFLIPTALVSAELSSHNSRYPGIYGWVRQAFGSKTALMTIWLQWANTIVWYPTVLSFIAATIAFLISPTLAQNPFYLIGVILVIFWTLTLIALLGIRASARFATFCTLVGLIAPMLLIIAFGAIWLFNHYPNQLHWEQQPYSIFDVRHFDYLSLIPDFRHFDNWVSLTAIITSFLGMELATVHVNQVENAQRNFPLALLISCLIIVATMLFGSLAIAVVLPQNDINLVDALMAAFNTFSKTYHLAWLTPIMAIMLVIGSIGGMTNWVISPAKGLLQAAEDGYLPVALLKINRHNAPSNILILQAILVSVCCMVFLFIPSVNGFYWLFTALSTQLYVLMYVFMFASAIALRSQQSDPLTGFTIPGGKYGLWFICTLGLGGCGLSLTIGFFPPSSIDFGGSWMFQSYFTAGLLTAILPALIMMFLKPNKLIAAA
jgi:amino acid transporter